MIIKGKSASHGRYLKGYLISKRDNDKKPEVFRIRGTATPDNYDLSANEIALSGLLSRGDKNIYHAIINPSTNDRSLTDEEWHTSIDKLLEGLGYQDQKHIAIRHIKGGRDHMHLMVDRYSYELNKLLPDGNNYYIHQDVAAELERLFGHEQTPRQSIYSKDRAKETKISHHKDILTDLWNGTTSGQDFLEQAESLGYHVGAGLEKRPFKVVLPDGRSVDLVRQLKDIKLADVYERINPKELPNEADVIKLVTDEIKMQRELAEQEFLRNLEDEQFLAHTEDREKEKKQDTELEAELARASYVDSEVMHSKPKKQMEEIKDSDVARRIQYEQELRNAQLSEIWFKLVEQYEAEQRRMSPEAAKWAHEQREKAYLEETKAIRQLDEKRHESYMDAHAAGEYKNPTMDEEKEKRIDDAKLSVRALENIYAGQSIPSAQIDTLKERYGKNILEELAIARQIELNKQSEKEQTQRDTEQSQKLSEEERKQAEREERRRQMLEAYNNAQDVTKGMKY